MLLDTPFCAGDSPASPLILLVENNDDMRGALKCYLQNLGYNVLTACNGLEGLAIYRNCGAMPWIISEVEMPYMGGAEMAAELGQEGYPYSLIFISGHPLASEKIQEVPGSRFLRKPFTLLELRESLREMVHDCTMYGPTSGRLRPQVEWTPHPGNKPAEPYVTKAPFQTGPGGFLDVPGITQANYSHVLSDNRYC